MSTLPDIEKRLYDGRTLVGHAEDGEHVAGRPRVACESIRAINHLTTHGPIPAPAPCRILGELKGIGHLLLHACAQIGRGLQQSLHVLDVYDHRRDPAESVTEAVLLLNQDLRKAAELAELLEAAQATISEQGYRSPTVEVPDATSPASHPESGWR